jgi:hypothetical protein
MFIKLRGQLWKLRNQKPANLMIKGASVRQVRLWRALIVGILSGASADVYRFGVTERELLVIRAITCGASR